MHLNHKVTKIWKERCGLQQREQGISGPLSFKPQTPNTVSARLNVFSWYIFSHILRLNKASLEPLAVHDFVTSNYQHIPFRA